MEVPVSELPDLLTLTSGLTSVLSRSGSIDGPVTVLDRQPNRYESTFYSEIVTCRRADGSDLQLFCKYETEPWRDGYGHRGGVPYEATVYRHILQPLQVSTPKFYGVHSDTATGGVWLILEYLDQSVHPARKMSGGLAEAARWIGQFQTLAWEHLSSESLSLLNKYDAEYYLGWARRTSQLAGPLHQSFPWLTTFCERFERLVDSLLAIPSTVIHGEYYYKNVLIRGGRIYSIDWESAAIALGEIDLVALTEGWPSKIARQCELAYQQARWPEGAPIDFERRLDLAHLYLHFRWLGNLPEWTTDENRRWRFNKMRSLGERLGLM